MTSPPGRPDPFQSAIRASAGLAALIAAVGAVGWLSGAPAILTYGAGLPWMVPSTILCLLLTAAAVLDETRGGSVRRGLALLAPVALIAGFHLLELASGWFVNVDARLFGAYAMRIGPPDRPVRMADVTAAALLALLLAHQLRRSVRGASWPAYVGGALAATVVTLCAGAGIGYATSLLRPFQTGLVDYVAFPTAVALAALGVAELLLLSRARPVGWSAAWVPPALVVALLVLTMQISLAAETYSRAERDRRVGQQAALLAREAERSYDAVVRSLQRMALRWNVAGGTPAAVWLEDASRYVADHVGVRGLAVRGLPGATLAFGAGPTLGDTLTSIVAPVHDAAGRTGELVMLVDLRARLREQLAAAGAGYRVTVAPLTGAAPAPAGSAVAVLGEGRWQVTVTELTRVDRSPFAVLLAAIGGLIALLAAVAAHFGRLALERGASVAAQARARARDREEQGRALELQQRRFVALLDNSPTVIFIKDQDGRYVHINRRYEEVFGCRRESFLGCSDLDLFATDVATALRARDAEVLRTGVRAEFEEVVPDAEGRPRTWRTQKFPIEMPGGETFLCGIAEDITDARLAQEALRVSEQRLALALEGTEEGLWDWHVPTGAVYFSPRWCRMLGYEPEEIRPHVDSWAELVHPDDLAMAMAAVQAHLRGETPIYETEHRVRTKTGGWCWILDRGKVLERAADGTPVRMVGTHTDVTARREAGALLEQRTAELARSNEELQRFAYVASHDLQEPLRTVRTLAGMVRERYRDRLDAEGEQMLGFLEDGATRMRDLVQGLLEYARAGAAPLRDRVDLRVVVAHAEANLAALLAETGGRVEVGPLPVVEGDARRLEQLVQNLLANALKFRGSAPPVVRIAEEPGAPPGFHRIVVADNGIGIAPQHTERIFQLFQRLHTREEYPGSGIGLAVCQRIVQAHGGIIDASPGAAGGTEIRFTLPRRTPT